MSLAFKAMSLARAAHAAQRRKHTFAPYTDHLAEVAGITAASLTEFHGISRDEMVAVAWLHDIVADQGVTLKQIVEQFGPIVGLGVRLLSDLEVGNRATRKAATCARLSAAPGWVQTIKYADLISNTPSIVMHDPGFARVYLAEKRSLLAGMRDGCPALHHIASNQPETGCAP